MASLSCIRAKASPPKRARKAMRREWAARPWKLLVVRVVGLGLEARARESASRIRLSERPAPGNTGWWPEAPQSNRASHLPTESSYHYYTFFPIAEFHDPKAEGAMYEARPPPECCRAVVGWFICRLPGARRRPRRLRRAGMPGPVRRREPHEAAGRWETPRRDAAPPAVTSWPRRAPDGRSARPSSRSGRKPSGSSWASP